MKTVDMADAAASLSDFVREALLEPIVVTQNGKPVAALTAIDAPTDLENLIVSSDPGFRALIERSRALYPPGTGVSTNEVRRRLRHLKARSTSRLGSGTRRRPSPRRRGSKRR
jgi:prevent-host-death family protein